MHYWPGITPFNIYTLSLSWWAYYVKSAKQVIEERKRASKGK